MNLATALTTTGLWAGREHPDLDHELGPSFASPLIGEPLP